MVTKTGILTKSGYWYSYNGERLGQGRENVKEFLRQHPEIAQEIEDKVRELVFNMPKDKDPQGENIGSADDYFEE